jgi:cytochrome c oxidase subunit II
MLAEIRLMPEQASTVAGEVDALYATLWTITVFFTVLIATLIIFFAIKYRRRGDGAVPPRIEGSTRLEVAWTVFPGVIGLGVFTWGAVMYFALAKPPADALEIWVVGKQWMWKLQHPGGQREINELHVPADQPVRLNMISEDVIHSFFIPDFRIKQDVLPGRYTTLWFTATRPGRYRLYCAEYCGTWHSKMSGWVVVQKPADYQSWLVAQAEGSAGLEGAKLFRQLRCLSCHSRGGEQVAPILENVAGSRVLLDNGEKVTADDTYLRESILNPRAKVVAGYRAVMPPFEGQVNEDDIVKLVTYIRSLGPGDTPPRVERTAPPIQDAPDRKKDEGKP